MQAAGPIVPQRLAFAAVVLGEFNVQLENYLREGKSPPEFTKAMGKHKGHNVRLEQSAAATARPWRSQQCVTSSG